MISVANSSPVLCARMVAFVRTTVVKAEISTGCRPAWRDLWSELPKTAPLASILAGLHLLHWQVLSPGTNCKAGTVLDRWLPSP